MEALTPQQYEILNEAITLSNALSAASYEVRKTKGMENRYGWAALDILDTYSQKLKIRVYDYPNVAGDLYCAEIDIKDIFNNPFVMREAFNVAMMKVRESNVDERISKLENELAKLKEMKKNGND